MLTYEASPLRPGQVTQATWRGGIGGTQVAFVTIGGGRHEYALPGNSTGYDCTAGMWAFFSQFLTRHTGHPQDRLTTGEQCPDGRLAPRVSGPWPRADPPLAYQWQKNGVDIPGATANWYTTPATTLADNGATFRAVVSNGSGSATSTAATLTVNPRPADPKITTQPTDQSVLAGQPVSFTVAAGGTHAAELPVAEERHRHCWCYRRLLHDPGGYYPDSGAPFRVVVTNRPAASPALPRR